MLPRAVLPCALVAALVAAAGCNRASARTIPEPPPLDMPAPPPRIVEAIETEPPLPGTLVDAPASGAPSSRKPPPRVEAAPKPEPAKPEPPPAPVEVPPPAEAPKPVTTLQTTPPEREAALAKDIQGKLDRAARDLSNVDYRRLNADAKEQYETAKRFATQAAEAVKGKNLVLALKLAENAADIAAQLANR
jgi:hypothetical protein